MYTIILISSLFLGTNSQPAQVESQQVFISQDACKLMAARMTEASGMKHECKKLQNPRSI